MLITKKLLDHLAHLSRVGLTDDESRRFVKDINTIVKYFKKLDAVKVEGVEPMIGAMALKNIFRADTVNLTSKVESVDEEGYIITAFPDVHDGHLRVPKIV